MRRPPAVARVLERVTATARSHDLFAPKDRVLVGVSGGQDSTCLLLALHMLARLLRIDVEVFHFDHRLRPDSQADASYVRRLASKLELPFHLRLAGSRPARGESVEAWAREARWAAADELRRDRGFSSVALGHTLDDQAETLLLAVIRGGGLPFVAGMPAKEGRARVRPLLEVRRSEVEAFVRSLRLRPREDPMNEDRRLLRAAIRHEVLPAMERATGRDVRPAIARTASLLRADADELFRQGVAALGAIAGPGEHGLLIDAAQLAALPEPIGGRVVELAMWQAGARPELETIRSVLDLARGRPGRRIDLPGGLSAAREREYVRLSRPSPESPS